MSYDIRWSRRALRDLETIRAYIANDSPRAAERVAAELGMLADSLSEMPNRGRRLDTAADVRELISGKYVLRYCITEQIVLIVRLKHSAQSG
jgi:addiction module RelE/StbE family toxin